MRAYVGIATRGDRDLRPLLAALRAQSHPPVRVVVASQSTAQIEPGSARARDLTVLRVHGTGYAAGRNTLLRYLRLTRHGWDVVAFLDDDELPDHGWLAAHLRTLAEHDADVTFGPIRRRWPDGASAAAQRADLPSRPDAAEGPYSGDGRTGNCALTVAAVTRHPVDFDRRLATTGGEDTAYFRALRHRGVHFAWSPAAVVHEQLRPGECSARALLRRAYRNGRTLPLLQRLGYGDPGAVWPPLREVRRLPKSGLLLGAGALSGRGDLLLRAGWEAAYLAGLATGLLAGRRRDG